MHEHVLENAVDGMNNTRVNSLRPLKVTSHVNIVRGYLNAMTTEIGIYMGHNLVVSLVRVILQAPT